MINFQRLKNLFVSEPQTLETGTRLLVEDKVRATMAQLPLRISLGNCHLDVYGDQTWEFGQEEPTLIITDGDNYFYGIQGFLRLEPGQKILVGHNSQTTPLFTFPQLASRKHLEMQHKGDHLIIKNLNVDAAFAIESLSSDDGPNRFILKRQQNLKLVQKLYGGPLRALPKIEALDCLEKVNHHLSKGRFRPKTPSGSPGALLELPQNMTPIIIGDLHGQFENLLKILCSGCYLEALVKGQAYLLLLGDMVHPDSGLMDDMRGSLFTMDLLCKLSLRFPNQVFMLLGNHDSFSTHIRKEGIQQGLVWEEWLCKYRGNAYKQAMERFYSQLPLVATSSEFFACHGGPPRMALTRESIIQARENPNIMNELLNNRITRPHHLLGYTATDIKKFRQALDIASETPLIVGHNPLSDEDTLWLDAGKIKNHHILYSSRETRVALFTRTISGPLVPLIYSAETLTAGLNEIGSDGSGLKIHVSDN